MLDVVTHISSSFVTKALPPIGSLGVIPTARSAKAAAIKEITNGPRGPGTADEPCLYITRVPTKDRVLANPALTTTSA